jgi:hypothetical protein
MTYVINTQTVCIHNNYYLFATHINAVFLARIDNFVAWN